MDDVAIARGLHLLGVVVWIGGVSMVTTVILPAVRRFKNPQEQVAFFEAVESRFAWQARFTTLLTGLSGFYMIYALGLWERYTCVAYFWMHMMTAVWFIFTVVLFVLEPLFLHRWFLRRATADPDGTFRLVQTLHRVLLTVSIVTLFASLLGAHGVEFFGGT
ncbi:MAG: hypothetical protein OEZ32_11325 [Nitrospinota bacterium]|nr:hypothetical protein [Nitrospinota bacterium]